MARPVEPQLQALNSPYIVLIGLLWFFKMSSVHYDGMVNMFGDTFLNQLP